MPGKGQNRTCLKPTQNLSLGPRCLVGSLEIPTSHAGWKGRVANNKGAATCPGRRRIYGKNWLHSLKKVICVPDEGCNAGVSPLISIHQHYIIEIAHYYSQLITINTSFSLSPFYGAVIMRHDL